MKKLSKNKLLMIKTQSKNLGSDILSLEISYR